MPEDIVVDVNAPAGDKSAGSEKPAGDKPAAGSPPVPAAGDKGQVEDPRIKGILADLQKERTARQAAEARHAVFEKDLERERKRVAIALGVNPPNPEEAEAEQVKAALYKLVPQLEKLTSEQVDKLLVIASQGEDLKSATQQHWERHSSAMLAKVQESIADELGGGDLTAKQKKMINNIYIAEASANPDFLKRHDAGDDTLIKEFVKDFIDEWGGPIRRTVTATELGRQRPLPNGRGRNVQGQAPKKINYSDPKAVEDAMVESYKNHGGTFSG